ncbi:peptidylprolyl isomerase [Teredinibacter turnerae]|uniref:Peptidyl-prolyl cis-trans isomerase n=1 Tax=Teredinibacter turnerae (strain ATCC 39867 / T7901) TaxID=377629 RepID=C5BL42_TERTT|nr:peptidylprolyl isomerase [Teredinibacter turnerae]ACR12590.1 peptidyl-prolyl cis-trans isomerase A precursor [Teredinibacter turnerae T7901]
MLKHVRFIGLVFAAFCVIGSAAAAKKEAKDNPQVVFETDLGKITIELFADEAPKTVANFLSYVDSEFYVGTIFHRVIPGFVVQGGGLTYDFKHKETKDPVVNESANGLKNLEGTLSMARVSDPDSATSQFFINVANNPHLDPDGDKAGYTVFGKVVEGFENVKKIEKEPRGIYRAYPEAPNYPVRVLRAYRLKASEKVNP